jgi:hypothetical protein
MPFMSDFNKTLTDVDFSEKPFNEIIGNNKKIITFLIDETLSHSLTKNNLTIVHNFEFVNSTFDQIQENLNNFFKEHTEKIDILYIGNLSNHLDYVENLLSALHEISSFSQIVFYFENPFHSSHRINYLNGNLPEIINLKKCFTLDSMLSLLENNNFSIKKFERSNKDMLNNDSKIIPYVTPKELIDALNFDPESKTAYYIFSVYPYSKSEKPIRNFLNSFPNVMVTEYLKNILIYYKSQMTQNSDSNDPNTKNLFDKLVSDVEILQNTNIENKKLIDQYVEKINNLVKEIETLQNINLNHQKIIKEKDDKINKLKQ